jgi:hypothetical protein
LLKIDKLNTDRPEILLPTAYLPPLEYMALMSVSTKVEIEIHETYPKQTWRNRCSIPSANGPLAISIPVEKPLGNHTPTRLINISKHLPWQKQHWRTIVSTYNKSAFFLFYRELLEPFYTNKAPELLIDWNDDLLKALAGEIGIVAKVERTLSFSKSPQAKLNLREIISPKAKPVAENHLFFKPYFQTFAEKHDFLANQSVIDLLFNLGPDTKKYLKECGEKLLHQFVTG